MERATGQNYPTEATYTCVGGGSLVGAPASRTCLADGSWDGADPTGCLSVPIYQDDTTYTNPCQELDISQEVGFEFSISVWVRAFEPYGINGFTGINIINFRETLNWYLWQNMQFLLAIRTTNPATEAESFNAGWGGVGSSVSAGDWHHVALTYDGAMVRVYLDGELDHTWEKDGALLHNGAVWYGCRRGSEYPFNGKMSHLRIYNSVLSAADVALVTISDSNVIATLNYATCAEGAPEVQQSGDYLLTAPDGSTFLSRCLLARDAGVPGGPPFTRFWYYDRRTNGWPEGEDDVLGGAYGTCSPDNPDYCFGRMPADVTAADTQLLVTEDDERLLWDFNPGCDTSDAVSLNFRICRHRSSFRLECAQQ